MNLVSVLSSELAELMEPVPVGGLFSIAPASDFCYSLELFIPKVLKVRYPEWRSESIDGFFVAYACRTRTSTLVIYGTCILITDQTCTPFHVTFEVPTSESRILKYQVLVGEPGSGHLSISGPKCNTKEAKILLQTVSDRIGNIEWTFEVNGEDLGA